MVGGKTLLLEKRQKRSQGGKVSKLRERSEGEKRNCGRLMGGKRGLSLPQEKSQKKYTDVERGRLSWREKKTTSKERNISSVSQEQKLQVKKKGTRLGRERKTPTSARSSFQQKAGVEPRSPERLSRWSEKRSLLPKKGFPQGHLCRRTGGKPKGHTAPRKKGGFELKGTVRKEVLVI